jgi:hypothetical protein
MTHEKEPVFGIPPPEYEPHLDDLNCKLISLKRKITPISDANLRRSKRGVAQKDGFKSNLSVPSKSKNKGMGKKPPHSTAMHHQNVDFLT